MTEISFNKKRRAIERGHSQLAEMVVSFLGRPVAYWEELDFYTKENMYEELVLENAALRNRLNQVEQERDGAVKNLKIVRANMISLMVEKQQCLCLLFGRCD